MAGRAVLCLVLTALAVGNMHVDALYPNGTAFACLPAPNNGTWCEIDVGATDPRLHATITPGTRYRYFGSKGSASIADAVATCARMQDGWRLAVVETREESRVLAAIEATQEGVLGKFSDKAAFWVNALSRPTDTANKSSLWTHNTSCWDVAMAGSYCSGVPGEDVARKRAEQPCVVYTDYGRDGRRGTAVGQRYDACFEAGANCAQAGQVSPTKNRFFCERDPAFNPQAECVASTTKTTTTTTTATAYATGLAAAERVERLEEEVTQCMIQTRGMRCEAKVAQSEALKTCVDNAQSPDQDAACLAADEKFVFRPGGTGADDDAGAEAEAGAGAGGSAADGEALAFATDGGEPGAGPAVAAALFILLLIATATALVLLYSDQYRFLPKATQLRAAPIATRLRAACRQGLGANKVYLATLAVLGIALFFGIIIPTSNTMLTKSGEVEMGVFVTVVEAGSGDSASDTCAAWSDGAGACSSALASKCHTAKAFSIIAIFTNFATLVLVASPVSWVGAASATGCTGFSYMLVFSIYASMHNNDYADDDADCGLAGNGLGYGGSFGLSVLNWLLCTAALPLVFLGSGTPAASRALDWIEARLGIVLVPRTHANARTHARGGDDGSKHKGNNEPPGQSVLSDSSITPPSAAGSSTDAAEQETKKENKLETKAQRAPDNTTANTSTEGAGASGSAGPSGAAYVEAKVDAAVHAAVNNSTADSQPAPI